MRHETYIRLLCIITAFTVVVLDLVAKAYWFGREALWTSFAPFLETVHHSNYGLLFNIPAPIWFTVGLSGLILAIALYTLWPRLSTTRSALGLGLLVGGAVGNGYDRVVFGFVRDWMLAGGRSAFNIADVAVVVGLLLLLLSEKEALA